MVGKILPIGISRASLLCTARKHLIRKADHHGIACARMLEEEMEKYKALNMKIGVTDDAGQMARARRIIRQRHPSWLLNHCFAHQINLMVRQVVMISAFNTKVKVAAAAATKIAQSSSKWRPVLRNMLDTVYGKKGVLNLLTLAETRWNSMQALLASQLCVRDGLKKFTKHYKNRDGFPSECLCWEDDLFWHGIEEAELAIRPFCKASFMMQQDGNCMADVFVMFVNLYIHLSDFANGTPYESTIVKDIEKRWATQEQHWFILSFALHPRYRKYAVVMLEKLLDVCGTWTEKHNVLSVARLIAAAKFYFGKHKIWLDCASSEVKQAILTNEVFKKTYMRRCLVRLSRDLRAWLTGKSFESGLDDNEYNETAHPVEFWTDFASENLELASFARFLLSAAVQSATCEHLFKTWMQVHTKARNRLLPAKMQGMGLVRRTLKRCRAQAQSNVSNDYKKPAKSKTRFINPKERMNVLEQQFIGRNLFGTLSQESTSSQVPAIEEQKDSLQDDEAGDAEEEASEDPLETQQEQPGDVVIEAWLQSLQLVMEDPEFEDIRDNVLVAEGTALDDFDETEIDDSYEVTDDELEPLPANNVDNYPQENKAYFDTKRQDPNYVRIDKDQALHIEAFVSIYSLGTKQGVSLLKFSLCGWRYC